ncbi:MAG: GntR family transcriptional regulator [Nevskiaceae bacterium]|jgi:DNA-binding GntR family transcriptional regulator|nr:GntR family transcriptional regulator [Nevskiaceae bacterium]
MESVIPISRRSLHDEVVERVRAMLIEGQIAPGSKLNERELCQLLHVSRTPLREAIKRLASEGLVDLLPNRGAVAVRLSEADVLSAFEVLAELEGMSGQLAAERMTAEELAQVQTLHHEMLASFERRDLHNYYRFNAQIHAAVNRAAKNPLLTKTYREINARVQSLRFKTNQNEAKWTRSVAEHEQMVSLLKARDAAGMRALLVEHLLCKRDTVLEQMRLIALAQRGVA